MLNFLKRKKKAATSEEKEVPLEQPSLENTSAPKQNPAQSLDPADSSSISVPLEKANKTGFFNRLKTGLMKTRAQLTGGLSNLILGKKELDSALIETIENQLLSADVGVDATTQLIAALTQKLQRKELHDTTAALRVLQDTMLSILKPCAMPITFPAIKPCVILVVGINGAGKTTTIGKMAHFYKEKGKSVILAAGDTFRAAAIEQLQAWGEKNHIPVIAQKAGADTAAVVFDAMESAKARKIDILIADTAGRLHTQNNLMEELKKVKRVLHKIDASAPHETLLVLDAGTGQNAINQAKQFHQMIGLTGLALTKLDGTAKGGVIFAIAKQMGLPIRFIGVGESIKDLRPFNAEEFVAALFA